MKKQPDLSFTKQLAYKRFLYLEKRLSALPAVKASYRMFMDEYEKLGHMQKVTENNKHSSSSSRVSYIPHHCVIKESSSTTKLRVVFDASVKDYLGNSLNSSMMVGPVIQDNLIDILIRFRKYPIAVSADVCKMYRQIRVREEDTELQRIFWRDDQSKPVETYRLLTVTYGTSSAPYLATRVLKQLARDDEKLYPLASQILLRDFYVDDLMTGGDSLNEVFTIQQELTKLLEGGGFQLRKWSSNNAEFLKTIDDKDKEVTVQVHDKMAAVKTLGMSWDTVNDTFFFNFKFEPEKYEVTKRTVLSEIAKIYDPLGLLSPFVTKLKVFLQELWKCKLAWDDTLPQPQVKQWIQFAQNMHKINRIAISRFCLVANPNYVDLIGFGDACERAYAATIYLRSWKNGMAYNSLLISKTKVAPINKTTLPRLELCAALLLAQLAHHVQKCIKINFRKIYLFSDSTIVLAWLKSESCRWKTFVANRVAQIQESTSSATWLHVKSSENPADIACRGAWLEDLDCQLWWKGPDWMQLEIPEVETSAESLQLKEEIDSIPTCNAVINSPKLIVFKNYSSLSRIMRIIAYVFKFIKRCFRLLNIRKCQCPILEVTIQPTASDLDHALLWVIKMVQHESFSHEISQLQTNGALTGHSNVRSLCPFLDQDGILRVGGRLKHAKLSLDQRHPILLPRSHHVVSLLIQLEHKRLLHAGCQLVQSVISRKYWIINARDSIRREIRRCVVCVKYSESLHTQQMASLPSARVNPSPPFSMCGVDYAGPFFTKAIGVRSRCQVKCYICLFVCFSTRAIHLEISSGLSTQSFLAALKRFVSRRSKPAHMYSDRGTNFVGACAELKKFLSSEEYENAMNRGLAAEGIEWHFNPPSAPHFGGLWEAGVRSVKYYLKRIVGNTVLNYEEFLTVICQIESCLNSRPLAPLSSDPKDFSALTPGHFLVGGPLVAMPETNLTDTRMNRLTRWQLVQQMTLHFWSRWSNEYLSRLQQRPKWVKPTPNIEINTMVLIKAENCPPQQWTLGRVEEIHPGDDGLVRVVTVRTASGSFRRPISKLCVLPVDTN